MHLSVIGMNGLLCFDKRLESSDNCAMTFSVPRVCSPSLIKGWGENVGRKICEVTPCWEKPFYNILNGNERNNFRIRMVIDFGELLGFLNLATYDDN